MDIWDKVFTGRPIKILTISFQIFKDCLPQILLGPLLNTLSLLSRLMLWLQFWLHFLWFIFENRKATENFFFRETRGKGLLSFFSCTFNFVDLSDVSYLKTCFHQFVKNVQVTPKNMENLSIPKLNVNHFIRFQVWRNASQPIFFSES